MSDDKCSTLLMYVPECQPLIDGCKKLFIESLPSNITSVLWIIGNFRISHYVDDTQENVYNILLLEKDVMVRFDFKLPHDFSIKELESELEKIGADKKRFALPCLNVTSNDEMSASCLQTLFDYAFENEYLLYRNKWAPLLLTKALSNDEIIYKNYSLYIAINIFRNINSAESLTQLGKIIRKLFSRQSTPLSAKDNNWLIKQYKLAVKEDNPKQFILYDLLNRANNPFRNLQENAEPEYDF